MKNIPPALRIGISVYVLYESWLLGVFCIYTTRESRSEEVCSAYAPRLWLGAYALQTSNDRDSPCFFMFGPCFGLCLRRLAYILYESWLLGVFCIYTTLKPRSSEVCSAYAPSQRRGAYALQTSSDLDSRVVYTRNPPHNHDLYITYIIIYICSARCNIHH